MEGVQSSLSSREPVEPLRRDDIRNVCRNENMGDKILVELSDRERDFYDEALLLRSSSVLVRHVKRHFFRHQSSIIRCRISGLLVLRMMGIANERELRDQVSCHGANV